MKYACVLLDLDGTLTDAAPGIVNSILYALERMSVEPPSGDNLHWTVGPPLRGSFDRLLQTDDACLVECAVEFYRERFSTIGWRENSLYEGVPGALEELKRHGLRLLLATSKPHMYARKIVEHFGINGYFDGLYGSEPGGLRQDKAELIAWLLLQEKLDPATCLMIGDREHDVLGARANGVGCLGVTYGYGSAEELTSAGAVGLAASPSEWARYFLAVPS